MRPMTQDTILKYLKTIYRCALQSWKWHVALRAPEIQEHYIGLFEKRYTPRGAKKQDLGLTHPPPPA